MTLIETDSAQAGINASSNSNNSPNVLTMHNVEKPGIDSDSSEQSAIIDKVQFSREQLVQIRALLRRDLQTAVADLKDEIKKEGQEVKKDFLTIFGLFASFVTFLSIQVQVFKNNSNVFELLGITSISISLVVFFALVINDVSKDKSHWKDFNKPTYVLCMLFATLGIFFLFYGGRSSAVESAKMEKQNKSFIEIVNSQKLVIKTLKWQATKYDSVIRVLSEQKSNLTRKTN